MNTKKITCITLWVNRGVALIVAALIFTLPSLLDWYSGLLGYRPYEEDMVGLAIAYDLCAVAMLIALWNVDKLLRSILKGDVFIRENVKRVRRVVWCCAAVALICAAAIYFVLPMAIFAIIMGFLCMAINVAACVLNAAVAIREENDLTI
ncbi:MAG: DUF2975 domain-containing protein [Ruminococcaceae bacterium]|nr:DUF2975 domain-containing protein [Oscillospiraceae bacterium]